MNAPTAKAVAAKPLATARIGRALLQRTCACGNGASGGGECEGCRKKRGELQRHAASQTAETGTPAIAPPIVHDVLCSSGQPLDSSTRAFMESRFDHDFSGVRIHTDARAAESAREVNALAYTVGQHIVFGRSQFDSSGLSGRRLLAHELTHVVQQDQSTSAFGATRINVDDRAEREAHRVAAAVTDGRDERVTLREPAQVRRQPTGNPPNTQQIYTQALTALQQRAPDIHRYLAPTRLNGGRQTVLNASTVDNTASPPVSITLVFTLAVTTASLPGNRVAIFHEGTRQIQPSGPNAQTFTAQMSIEISNAASVTPSALEQNLFHEGLHLLLYVEGLARPTPSSAHVGGLANYRNIARSFAGFDQAKAEIEVYADLDWQTRRVASPPSAARLANEIASHIVEEKYAFDQERRQFGGSVSNGAIVRAYIQDMFNDAGVRWNPADTTLADAITKFTQALDLIDRRVSAPATPAPGPSGSGTATAPAPPPSGSSPPPRPRDAGPPGP